MPTPVVATVLVTACAGKEDAKPADTTPAVGATGATPALGPGEAMLPVRGGRIWYREFLRSVDKR